MSNENSVSSQSSDSGLELRRAIDTASKFIAILVIFLYICGFLITSVHYFNYGFSEINPFRPRIFAAGAWFLFFVGMPIGLAKFSQLWGKTRDRFELPTKLGFYLTLSITLAMVLQLVFYDFGCRFKDLFSIYSLVVVGSIFFWFLLDGAMAVYVSGASKHSNRLGLPLIAYTLAVPTLMLSILLFGSWYYPHIKSSWGGGAPVSVTLYFAKDSFIMPSQSVTARLIDETDAGFYVVGKEDKYATFIPRNEIEAVFYSDSPSGSSLLKSK